MSTHSLCHNDICEVCVALTCCVMLTLHVMMTHVMTTCHCDTDFIVLSLTLVSHKSQNLAKTL